MVRERLGEVLVEVSERGKRSHPDLSQFLVSLSILFPKWVGRKHPHLLVTRLPAKATSNYNQWPLTFLTSSKLFQKGPTLSLHLHLTRINSANDCSAICSKASGIQTFSCSFLFWNDSPTSSFWISHAMTTDAFLILYKLGLTADLLTDHWHQQYLQLFWLDDFWNSS